MFLLLRQRSLDIRLLITVVVRKAVNPTKEELQQGLKNVDRSSLITNKEKGTKAYMLVADADYQTQVNAMRSVHNEKMKP